MTIKYNHPPVIGGNPFENFNPSDISHYPNGPGIYIYGFRKFIDGEKNLFHFMLVFLIT